MAWSLEEVTEPHSLVGGAQHASLTQTLYDLFLLIDHDVKAVDRFPIQLWAETLQWHDRYHIQYILSESYKLTSSEAWHFSVF